MISFADIQLCYNDLYKEARRYIWDFPAVEALADLEIASYETCPNIQDIRNKLAKFQQFALNIIRDDEEFKKAYDAFEEFINSDDTSYAKLNQVKEVV